MNINVNLPKDNNSGKTAETVGWIAAGATVVAGLIALGSKVFGNKTKGKEDRKTQDNAAKNDINVANAKAKADADAKIRVMEKEAELKEQERKQKLKDFEERERIKNMYRSSSTSSVSQEENGKDEQGDGDEIEIPDARNIKAKARDKRYILPNMIFEGEIATIYGHEKIGKSFVGAQIAKDATMGGTSSLFPKDPISIPKCRVYYYSAENWKDNMADRLPDGFLDDHDNFQLLVVDGYKVGNLLKLLRHQLNADRGSLPILVIIDNISAIVDNVYSGEIDTLMSELILIWKEMEAQEKSLTIILFAHDKADKDLASAASVGRKGSTIIRFSVDSNKDYLRTIQVANTNKGHKRIPYTLHFVEEMKLHLEYVEDIEEPTVSGDKLEKPSEKSKKEQVIELAKKGLKPADIAKELNMTPQAVNYHLHPKPKKAQGKGKKS